MLVDKVEVRYHNLYGFECRGIFAKETIKVRMYVPPRWVLLSSSLFATYPLHLKLIRMPFSM